MKLIHFETVAIFFALILGSWGVAHGAESNISSNPSADRDLQVLGTETVRSTDSHGNVVEKRIVKKLRARTVVDFEEASIEGKVKKPNAAYLLHGADLDFKHLYHVKHGQRGRVISSYEYLR